MNIAHLLAWVMIIAMWVTFVVYVVRSVLRKGKGGRGV